MGARKLDGYSYKEFEQITQTLGEHERAEFIFGEIVMMAGASAAHQDMVLNIASALKERTKDTNCLPRIAPYDLKLSVDGMKNVVQPDIMLFCEDALPCAIFEVLSPSTASKDKGIKKELYERAGIREYFLVDTEQLIIDSYRLEDGRYYYVKGFAPGDMMPVACLDMELDIASVFGIEHPGEEKQQ